jgi:hypothetical protein
MLTEVDPPGLIVQSTSVGLLRVTTLGENEITLGVPAEFIAPTSAELVNVAAVSAAVDVGVAGDFALTAAGTMATSKREKAFRHLKPVCCRCREVLVPP